MNIGTYMNTLSVIKYLNIHSLHYHSFSSSLSFIFFTFLHCTRLSLNRLFMSFMINLASVLTAIFLIVLLIHNNKKTSSQSTEHHHHQIFYKLITRLQVQLYWYLFRQSMPFKVFRIKNFYKHNGFKNCLGLLYSIRYRFKENHNIKQALKSTRMTKQQLFKHLFIE